MNGFGFFSVPVLSIKQKVCVDFNRHLFHLKNDHNYMPLIFLRPVDNLKQYSGSSQDNPALNADESG